VARPAAEPVASAATLRAATAALIGEAASATGRFGIAVSGGADSLALLLLAADAFPGRIAAATVDHRLRPASADEAVFVAGICAARGIPHHILTAATPPQGSVQAAARALRYRLLDDWRTDTGLDWVMTAHHADDQAETLVMRLNRASGIDGLAGVRARNGHLLRPLLGVRRAALSAVVDAAGLVPVDDPSNRDPRYDRARVRAALAASDLIDPLAAAQSAAWLAEAQVAIDWAAERLANERLRADADGVTLDTADLPDALVRRLLARALATAQATTQGGADLPRGAALTNAITRLNAGEKMMLGNHLLTPDRHSRTLWRITRAPPRRP
jgi:tRNA(Ile)-lysidine synthase